MSNYTTLCSFNWFSAMGTRSFLKTRPFHTNLCSFLLVLPNEQPIIFEDPAISHQLVQSFIGYSRWMPALFRHPSIIPACAGFNSCYFLVLVFLYGHPVIFGYPVIFEYPAIFHPLVWFPIGSHQWAPGHFDITLCSLL